MRTLKQSLLAVVALVLAACTLRAPTTPGSGPATVAPSATAVAPTTVPSATPTATPVPATPDAGRPLAVDGQLLTAVVVVTGSPLRYGLLGGGLARSQDGGQTWQLVSNLALPAPVVSRVNPDLLYAGAMPSCYKDDEAPVFRRSTDGGRAWTELSAGRGIRPVAAWGAGEVARVYGISCQGLHVSDDGGETWTLRGPTHGFDITAILPVSGQQLPFLAVLTSEGGTSHLAWFNDQGELEQNLTDGLSFWGLGVLAQAGSSLYLADSTGVRRYDEASGRWDLFADGLEDVVLKSDPLTEGLSEADAARGFGLFALVADPANPRQLGLGTVRGLYTSNDGGEHWRLAEVPVLDKVRINNLAWDTSAPDVLYVTTPGGVFAVRLP